MPYVTTRLSPMGYTSLTGQIGFRFITFIAKMIFFEQLLHSGVIELLTQIVIPDPDRPAEEGSRVCSNRNGAAVHVSMSFTDPPPTPSILIRGNWSMGRVLDIYWKFGDAGDCYAGRILAGLSCDSEAFDVCSLALFLSLNLSSVARSTCSTV